MENLIFAIDNIGKEDKINYAKALSKDPIINRVFAIKIGTLEIFCHSLSVIQEIKDITDKRVICDIKLADIPYISGEIAKKVSSAGADFIVVHGVVGNKVIDVIKEAAPGLKIIVVSEMTHNSGGFTPQLLVKVATMAKENKVFGIIGPGNRPDRIKIIKDIVGDKVKVFAAGVSEEQGGEEQEAIMAGADFLITGRRIRNHLDEIAKDLKIARVDNIVFVLKAIFATLLVVVISYFIFNYAVEKKLIPDGNIYLSMFVAFNLTGCKYFMELYKEHFNDKVCAYARKRFDFRR